MAGTYLVFGDLHGRILPAFRLALAWSRDHQAKLDGLLQVGDLGYFPDVARLDKATLRHAQDDPLELGARDVAEPNKLADAIFAEPDVAPGLWFTAGNHEDYDALEGRAAGGGRADYPVDAYLCVHCVRDGRVAELPGALRVGALWGIDPGARRNAPSRARIRPRSATELAAASFDVLLAHDAPRDVMFENSGSDDISALLSLARPAFMFFGHYRGTGRRVEGDWGPTQAHHMSGMELRGYGGTAEAGSVGVLRWQDGRGSFEYVSPSWLRTFTRHNWKHR